MPTRASVEPSSVTAAPGAESPDRAPLVVALGDASPDDPLLGGKASSLNRLAQLGRPIPPGFCISAAAYRAWVATVADPAALSDAIRRLPDEAARSEINVLLEATRTPPAVTRAVHDAVAVVAASIDRPLLAVRSSALDEDGAAASFAGVHETELGRTPDEVEPALRRCWLSLWSRTAVAYRARRGLAFADAAMAVVVQALVPAETSAVVFKRHPVTGRDDVLINAIRGLGEPMVAGEATPETIVVSRSGHVLERIPGDHGERLFVRSGEVVAERDREPGPVLSDADAVSLAEMALDVEGRFGGSVDIETVRADDRWILLQARPITTR
jgi:rifampicin phosphotransferase